MLYVLPETACDLVVVQANQQLTTADFQEHLQPLLEEKTPQFGQVRGVLFLDNEFTGFEPDSIWEPTHFAEQHGDAFLRLAVVAEEKWQPWVEQLNSALSNGECKHYRISQFLLGLHWSDSGEDE